MWPRNHFSLAQHKENEVLYPELKEKIKLTKLVQNSMRAMSTDNQNFTVSMVLLLFLFIQCLMCGVLLLYQIDVYSIEDFFLLLSSFTTDQDQMDCSIKQTMRMSSLYCWTFNEYVHLFSSVYKNNLLQSHLINFEV